MNANEGSGVTDWKGRLGKRRQPQEGNAKAVASTKKKGRGAGRETPERAEASATSER